MQPPSVRLLMEGCVRRQRRSSGGAVQTVNGLILIQAATNLPKEFLVPWFLCPSGIRRGCHAACTRGLAAALARHYRNAIRHWNRARRCVRSCGAVGRGMRPSSTAAAHAFSEGAHCRDILSAPSGEKLAVVGVPVRLPLDLVCGFAAPCESLALRALRGHEVLEVVRVLTVAQAVAEEVAERLACEGHPLVDSVQVKRVERPTELAEEVEPPGEGEAPALVPEHLSALILVVVHLCAVGRHLVHSLHPLYLVILVGAR
mmetsp:Transcript_14348/g.38718  ORF Transcript_14348/g.38718 Transcript_14348/m.38718 type:complete len:259 (-) Transcript_14348:937-1713(-)